MRTNEDKKKFLAALDKTPFVLHASKQAGIDKSTIYRWRKKDKKFNDKVEEALSIGRAGLFDVAESQIAKKINQGDFKACKFYMENNDRRYIKPRPLNIFMTKSDQGLTDEQREKLDMLLSKSPKTDDPIR